jgi:hypothetical protein
MCRTAVRSTAKRVASSALVPVEITLNHPAINSYVPSIVSAPTRPATSAIISGQILYLVGNQHWHATRQRFHHCDAVVVLMRRKHEDIRGSQRAPFYVTDQEPSPGNSFIYSEALGLFDQSLLPTNFICSRNEKLGVSHIVCDPRKRLDQQITTLCEMDPA